MRPSGARLAAEWTWLRSYSRIRWRPRACSPAPALDQANRTAVVVPAQKPTALLADLRELILQAREGVARAVDSGLTTLYWHVGQRIRQDILKEKRADYGAQIVAALGATIGERSLAGDSGKRTSAA